MLSGLDNELGLLKDLPGGIVLSLVLYLSKNRLIISPFVAVHKALNLLEKLCLFLKWSVFVFRRFKVCKVLNHLLLESSD